MSSPSTVHLAQPLQPPSQRSLFEDTDGPNLPTPPAVQIVDSLIASHELLFQWLADNIEWTTRFKSRNSRSFGVSYHSGNGPRRDRALPAFLHTTASAIHDSFGFMPNNCLINDYPSGDNYISFHSDQDMEMNDHTGVVIVSFGEVREMVLRNIKEPGQRYHYPLPPGSGFYMTDALQQQWQHAIPKQPGRGRRISMSFRSLRI